SDHAADVDEDVEDLESGVTLVLCDLQGLGALLCLFGLDDLIDRIAADPLFGADAESLKASLDPARYVGRAPEQVDDFLNEVVKPLLAENADLLGLTGEVRV
ncbi:MAG: hypothetical protein IIY83_08865, partial [Lachnospiraceae bacterium]|nr:hypothetical protein [Lachnospiraceae bacterium]